MRAGFGNDAARYGAGHVVAAGVLLAAVACQAFSPLPGAGPAPGEDVRLVLVDAAARRLAPTLGVNVAAIDGRVLDAGLLAGGDDSIRVAVRATTLTTGERVLWRDERVAIAHADVAALQQRRISTGRSVALGALAVAGAVVAAHAVGGGNGGGFVGGGTGTAH